MTPIAQQTIMSQYANSDEIIKIISDMSDRLEGDTFTDRFYDMVMRISTAGTWGLDVWGRIVGVSRRTRLPPEDGEFLGFKDGFYPFNNRPMFGGFDGGGSHEFSNDAYRQLIIAKAISNIIDVTAININSLLKFMFPNGWSFFRITGHMKAEYVFQFRLSSIEREIVYNSGILPSPCGVGISIIEEPMPTPDFVEYWYQTMNFYVPDNMRQAQ